MMFRSSLVAGILLLTVSCQVVKPYAPPPQKALVDSVEVEIREFAGRPEAHAIVKGRLSSNGAQLVDPRQSRLDETLYVDVLEQTPRDASLIANLSESPPFQTRIPVELLGLEPGATYTLSANGIQTTFQVPVLHAEAYTGTEEPEAEPAVTLVDEFIAIEDFVAPESPAPEAN